VRGFSEFVFAVKHGLVNARQVAGANRRWCLPFRYRGSRHEPSVAQLSKLDHVNRAITILFASLSQLYLRRFGWTRILQETEGSEGT
jgi:hypothetical protein